MKTTAKIIYGTLALLALNCFAFLSTAQALVPPPDGGYAGGNTAEGKTLQRALRGRERHAAQRVLEGVPES
jgi:hypothetical protein